jgi:hypothetical protein
MCVETVIEVGAGKSRGQEGRNTIKEKSFKRVSESRPLVLSSKTVRKPADVMNVDNIHNVQNINMVVSPQHLLLYQHTYFPTCWPVNCSSA